MAGMSDVGQLFWSTMSIGMKLLSSYVGVGVGNRKGLLLIGNSLSHAWIQDNFFTLSCSAQRMKSCIVSSRTPFRYTLRICAGPSLTSSELIVISLDVANAMCIHSRNHNHILSPSHIHNYISNRGLSSKKR
jgi:hypothetical protein